MRNIETWPILRKEDQNKSTAELRKEETRKMVEEFKRGEIPSLIKNSGIDNWEKLWKDWNKEREEEKKKKKESPPKILYHGSSNPNLEEIKPNPSTRDPKEGKVVFGAKDLAFATMFLVPNDDTWTAKGRFLDKYFIIISDEKRFRELDKGGAIYAIPGDKFQCDLEKGLGRYEWTTKEPVKPIKDKTIIYKSALDAMIENGVEVYFVNKKTFEDIKNIKKEANELEDPDFSIFHHFHILKILCSLKSENQKRVEKQNNG